MKTKCDQMAVCQAKPCKPECRSTGNAFTGATNSIDWSKHASTTGGTVNSGRNGLQIYLPNSRQQQTYSSAGLPK